MRASQTPIFLKRQACTLIGGLLLLAFLAGTSNAQPRERWRSRTDIQVHVPAAPSGPWPGSPSATFDCKNFPGGASWDCGTGYSFAANGGNVTSTATPYGTGAVFNGVTWLSAGNIGTVTGDVTMCAVVYPTTYNVSVILGKDAAGARSFFLGTLMNSSLYVFAGPYKYASAGWGSANVWQVICASFHNGGMGGSTILINNNGHTGSEPTAFGPMAASSTNLTIARRDYGGSESYFTGTIARVTYWLGWFASADQLAAMVANPPTG